MGESNQRGMCWAQRIAGQPATWARIEFRPADLREKPDLRACLGGRSPSLLSPKCNDSATRLRHFPSLLK